MKSRRRADSTAPKPEPRTRAATPKPQVEIPDIRRAPVTIPVACGQCIYFHRYATYALPCDQLGTLTSSEPCNRFRADPSRIDGDARTVRDVLHGIGQLRDPALVASILSTARACRRYGRHVGEVVYFRVLGGDYLCNYAFGVVTGADRNGIVIMGARGFVARLQSSEIMGRIEWETLRDSLTRRNRINDPQGGLRKIAVRGKSRLVQYEPPEARLAAKPRGPRSSFGGKKKRGPQTIVLSSGDVR